MEAKKRPRNKNKPEAHSKGENVSEAKVVSLDRVCQNEGRIITSSRQSLSCCIRRQRVGQVQVRASGQMNGLRSKLSASASFEKADDSSEDSFERVRLSGASSSYSRLRLMLCEHSRQSEQ